MNGTIRLGTVIAAIALCFTGCKDDEREARPERAESTGGETRVEGENRCNADSPDREVSEYDTSGDEYPDVRKVFLSVGEGALARLVLICREADLNGDGTKDIVRYYNDEGRPVREESDRNFDGRMDEITFFEAGRIVRQEQDTSGNGRVDTKIFFENGEALRTERDIAGRSTADNWVPDRWEYFEGGRMIRMGTDVDGDGRVDRWDRDSEWQREMDRREADQIEQAEQENAESGDSEDA